MFLKLDFVFCVMYKVCSVYWVNLSKRVGMDGISLGLRPRELLQAEGYI